MSEFTIRQGDTASKLSSVLRDDAGDPVDIQGATISFRMALLGGGSLKVNQNTSNDQVGNGSDGSKGKVSYTWQAADTNTPGLYVGVFRATFPGAVVQSFPNGGFVLVRVTADLPQTATAPFASSADLEDRLGVTLTAGEHERAHRLLLLATGLIQDESGQTVTLVTGETLTLPGVWSARLRLPERPVVSVTSVRLDGVLLVEGDDWYLDGDELVRSTGWGGPQAEVEVVYTHGHSPVPGAVKTLCLEVVARAWVNPGNARQEGYGAVQVTYGAAGLLLTGDERRLLGKAFGSRNGTVTLR